MEALMRVGGGAGRWASAVGLVLLLVAPTKAETGVDVAGGGVDPRFWLLPPGERLVAQDTVPTGAPPDQALPPVAEPRPKWLGPSLIGAGALTGSALNSFFDGNHQSYHLGDEGW